MACVYSAGSSVVSWQVGKSNAATRPEGRIGIVLQAGDDAQREWRVLIAGGAHGGTSGGMRRCWLCGWLLGIVPESP